MKLAILGSYGHCGVVLDALAQTPKVELAAVAKWGPDDPLSFVGRHPAVKVGVPIYEHYRQLLEEVRPDIAAVFMPLYRNAEASTAAAQAGCHIVSEKPLATALDDLHALRGTVTEAGVRIAALMTMRCEGAVRAVREAVAAGRIGQPALATAQKSYPFAQRDDYYKTRQTYGGSIPWQAIHAIDTISHCAGKDFLRVAAMHSNVAHPTHGGMEDNGGLLMEMVGGGHAVITFDYFRPWSEGVKRSWADDRLRIAGADGVLEILDGGKKVDLLTPRHQESLPVPEGRNFFADFVNSLEGSAESPISTKDSFRITEIALRAREAADLGQVMDL
jgi:predicted dehydrogenase